jgi:phosphoribosylformylglycinamidine synthase PurS subunit
MRVRVHVTLKPGVLDVQGKAVGSALRSLGYEGAGNVRQGKFFTFDLAGSDEAAARAQVDEMCRKLLANTVIEDYRYEIDAEPGR